MPIEIEFEEISVYRQTSRCKTNTREEVVNDCNL